MKDLLKILLCVLCCGISHTAYAFTEMVDSAEYKVKLEKLFVKDKPDSGKKDELKDLITPAYDKFLDDVELARARTYKGEFPIKKYYFISDSVITDDSVSYALDYPRLDSYFPMSLLRWNDMFLLYNYEVSTRVKYNKGRNLFKRLFRPHYGYMSYRYALFLPPNPVAIFGVGEDDSHKFDGWFILYENDQVVWVDRRINMYRNQDAEDLKNLDYKRMIETLKFPRDGIASEVSYEFVRSILNGTPMYPMNERYQPLLQYFGTQTELPRLIPGRKNLYYTENNVSVVAYNLTPEFYKLLQESINYGKTVGVESF